MKRRRNCRRIFQKIRVLPDVQLQRLANREMVMQRRLFSRQSGKITQLYVTSKIPGLQHTLTHTATQRDIGGRLDKKRQMHAKGQQGRRGRHIIEQAREQSRATQLDSEGNPSRFSCWSVCLNSLPLDQPIIPHSYEMPNFGKLQPK